MRIVIALIAVASFTCAHKVYAAEGGMSLYLPGAVGDLLIAAPPEPGLTIAETLWYQNGDVGTAVLQGAVNLNLDLDLFLSLTAGFYAFEQSFLGATYSVGAVVPFGHANLDAQVIGSMGGIIEANADATNLADIALYPVQLNWVLGEKLFARFSQTVFVPTGGYDVDQFVNLGRNYLAFGTAGALTYFDPTKGRELSVAPGFLFNTENDETNYKTGTEFYMDFTANQFFAENFAIGLRGYWYRQIGADSGSGAILGDFKSRSWGLGPGFFWAPKALGGNISILGKYIHDFDATNRFESDFGMVTVAGTF